MQDTYASSGPGLVFWIVCLVVFVFEIASHWRVYTKAGKPGWASIVPLYNLYVLLQIVGRPWWWLLLCFIPLVNIVVSIIICVDLAKCFGKGVGFALGIIFLPFIFIPVLAWGDAQYQGPPPRSL